MTYKTLHAESLNAALDEFGASSKKTILTLLNTKFGISLIGKNCSSKAEIEYALVSLLGLDAAMIIFEKWNLLVYRVFEKGVGQYDSILLHQ